MSVQLTLEQEASLAHLAQATDRTTDDLAQEAVANYILYKNHFADAVHEGLAAADRGELHDHDEVMAMMDEIIANG